MDWYADGWFDFQSIEIPENIFLLQERCVLYAQIHLLL